MPKTTERYSVALEGFSDFERGALASYFRLAGQRTPAYVQVAHAGHSDFLIADADHASALDAVQRAGRVRDTVFVGARAPQGAMAWLPRPIDPVHIVRELDTLVEQRHLAPSLYCDPAPEPEPEPPAIGDVDLLLPDIDTSFAAAATGTAPAGGEVSFVQVRGGKGRDVLVVEDSAIARQFLRLRLQRLGYRVHLAKTGEEALELLARQRFALVFADIVLGAPGSVDGLQVCQQVKHRAAVAGMDTATAVVMVTALSGSADRVRGSLAGCDAYLTKPLLEADFIAALRHVDRAFDWAGDSVQR